VLPAEHHDDERVGDSIEAFLEGPPVRAGRPGRARKKRPDLLRTVRRPVPMDTRTDWDAALRHEDARVARYGRPASVLVLRFAMLRPGLVDRYAGRVGAVVREHARETDRVTRAAPDRFHVLLPETGEAEAMGLAERVRDACADLLPGRPGSDLEILAATASASRGRSLHDALRIAQRDIAQGSADDSPPRVARR
jgi:hypothetical protein